MSKNLNFEDKISAQIDKIQWKNPSFKSKLKRFFKLRSEGFILAHSDRVHKFRENNQEFFREIQNLNIASFNVARDIESSPVEKILNLRLQETFNDGYLAILEANLDFLFPHSLSYFVNLNWPEYIAFIDEYFPFNTLKKKQLYLIVELAYCTTRSAYSYHMFCLRMLEMKNININKNNLAYMRIYLECLNHAEMNLVLNRAVIDKVLENYAHLNETNVSGKGDLNKKIDKLTKAIERSGNGKNHWNAFVQIIRSDKFEKLNSYRTGLVHKFSPSSTAFHKKSFDGIFEGLRSVEELVKDSNHMSFFALTTLLMAVNELSLESVNSSAQDSSLNIAACRETFSDTHETNSNN
jgi:hypothetical protein